MAFTNDVASRPVLVTFGAGPCVIVAAYNPKTHEASLTHIDASSDIRDLWPLISKIDGVDEKDPIEVHISGGNEELERAADIMRVLSYMNNVTIKSAYVDQSHGLSDAMAIDARTGNISAEFIPTNVDTPQGAMQGVENRLRSWAYTGKNSIVVAHNFIEDPIFEDIDKVPKPKAGNNIDPELSNFLKEMSDRARQLEQIKQMERSMNKGN